MSRQPKVAKWEKDGAWHISVPYEPTLRDRKMFPASYPADDPGPFFVWSDECFNTEGEARQALRERIKVAK